MQKGGDDTWETPQERGGTTQKGHNKGGIIVKVSPLERGGRHKRDTTQGETTAVETPQKDHQEKGGTTPKGYHTRGDYRKLTSLCGDPTLWGGGDNAEEDTTGGTPHTEGNRQGTPHRAGTTKGTPQGGQTGKTTACKAHHSRYHRGDNRIKETPHTY